MKKTKLWRKFVGGLLVSLLFLSGCKTAPRKEIETIIPVRVVDAQPSWDNNIQNSGIIGTVPGGFEITQAALDRYNGLLDLYGPTMVPKVVRDTGVLRENGKIILTPEAMVHFIMTNQAYKNGVKP